MNFIKLWLRNAVFWGAILSVAWTLIIVGSHLSGAMDPGAVKENYTTLPIVYAGCFAFTLCGCFLGAVKRAGANASQKAIDKLAGKSQDISRGSDSEEEEGQSEKTA